MIYSFYLSVLIMHVGDFINHETIDCFPSRCLVIKSVNKNKKSMIVIERCILNSRRLSYETTVDLKILKYDFQS